MASAAPADGPSSPTTSKAAPSADALRLVPRAPGFAEAMGVKREPVVIDVSSGEEVDLGEVYRRAGEAELADDLFWRRVWRGAAVVALPATLSVVVLSTLGIGAGLLLFTELLPALGTQAPPLVRYTTMGAAAGGTLVGVGLGIASLAALMWIDPLPTSEETLSRMLPAAAATPAE